MAQKIKKGTKKLPGLNKSNDEAFKSKAITLLLNALLVAVLFLTIWQVNIYEKTFIPAGIPFTFWLITGLITTVVLRKFITTYLLTSSWLLQIVFNTITWGGIVVFTFMWANYKFASSANFNINERIISKGYLPKGKYGHCNKPYIVINYNGHEKQLNYYCETQIELYESIDLALAKGLFGFDIIVQSQLKVN